MSQTVTHKYLKERLNNLARQCVSLPQEHLLADQSVVACGVQPALDRFGPLFREAWLHVPAEYQQLMLCYWRTHGRRMLDPRLPSPEIVVSEDGPAMGDMLASNFAGTVFWFHGPTLAEMPDAAAVALIGLEFCRAALFMTGFRELDSTEIDDVQVRVMTPVAMAEMERQLATDWGFAMGELGEWVVFD